MMHDMEQRMQQIGYTLEDSLRLQGKTMEQYHQELEPAAERRVKAQLVLAELSRREGIEVTDEEVEAELQRMAGQASRRKRPASAILEAFGSPQGRSMIRQDLRTSRTLERLRAIVTGQVAAAPVAPQREAPSPRRAPASVEAMLKRRPSRSGCGRGRR